MFLTILLTAVFLLGLFIGYKLGENVKISGHGLKLKNKDYE